MSSCRALPLPPWWNAASGQCRWCGDKLERNRGRRVRWHQECVADYLFRRTPSQDRVANKSDYRCADCGRSLWMWKRKPMVIERPAELPTNGNRYATWALLESHVPRKFGLGCTSNRDTLRIVAGDFCPIERDPIFCEDFSRPMNANGFHPTEYVRPAGFYTAVERYWISWQIDHTVPLWSVDRTRPWTEIIKFWGLANLAALCDPCHKAKTAREAADRARRRRGTQELALCVGAPA